MAEPPPPAIPMAELPPAVPQLLPPLRRPPSPQLLLPLRRPPSPLSPSASSTPSKRRVMAEPPPALPQPPGVPVAAAPLHLTTSSIAGAQLVAPTSAPDHVAQNPSIGDSGEVESRAGASTAEVLPHAKILMEEDSVAGDGSTSLSTICARMIQSCTYTVAVKVCGSGTEINGDTCFSWQIIEGTSTNLKDLIACIAGTLSFPLWSEQNIYLEYVDCTSGKNISVSNDEECMRMYECFHQNRTGQLIIKYSDRSDNHRIETALAIEDKTAKSTSPKTTSKSKRSKIISAAPDSPAMSTRSKKRAAPNSQPMATRSKKKLKL